MAWVVAGVVGGPLVHDYEIWPVKPGRQRGGEGQDGSMCLLVSLQGTRHFAIDATRVCFDVVGYTVYRMPKDRALVGQLED
ncbi:hypothetical protein IF2G_01956 [Cordyceps javanica]|nr:hypothetical protein IF2G_01956 [Cordyceps javanica]